MAIKQQCENCPDYNSANGLCTRLWGIPVWDSNNCELFGTPRKKPAMPIQKNDEVQRDEERRKSTIRMFEKPIEIVETINPVEYIEQKTKGNSFAYRRVYSFYLSYYSGWILLCLGLLPLILLCILSIKSPIMIVVWLLIALFWGGCWILHIISSRKHRYDCVFVGQEKLWIAIENRCHEFLIKRIVKCDFEFNANLFFLKNRIVFIVETDDCKQYSFDLSSLGVNIFDFIKAINQSSNREIVDASNVKTKQWKYLFAIIAIGLLYMLYRLLFLKH